MCGENMGCADNIVRTLRDLKNNEITEKISKQIIDNDALDQLESRADHGSIIYVVSSNFELEQQEPFKSTIVDNLVQGVAYRYIIPLGENRDTFDAMTKALFEAYFCKAREKNPKLTKKKARTDMVALFSAKTIPDDFVFLTTFVYKFDGDDNEKNEVIVKLPYETEHSQQQNQRYVYQVPDEQTQARSGLLKKISGLYRTQGESVSIAT
jgi:hypothetical protein